MQRPPAHAAAADDAAHLSEAPPPRSGESRGTMWVIVATLAIVGLLAGGGIILATGGDKGPPATPTDVTANARTCSPPTCARYRSTVTLSWTQPDRGPRPTGYLVYRDGQIAPGQHLGPSANGFTDADVGYGERHEYQVVALGSDANAPATPPVTARVPLPTPVSAQLVGRYDVRLIVRMAHNLRSVAGIEHPVSGAVRRTTWSFARTCGTAGSPCAATWQTNTGALRPDGRNWTGRSRGPQAQCFDGSRVPAPVDLSLTSEGAGLRDDGWVVTRFTGTFVVSFHCAGFTPSRAVMEVSGRRS